MPPRRSHARARAHAPEEVEEAERLDAHADKRPADEDEEDPAEEAERPAQLLLAREKVERLGWANDERHPGQEKDLWREWWCGCADASAGERL